MRSRTNSWRTRRKETEENTADEKQEEAGQGEDGRGDEWRVPGSGPRVATEDTVESSSTSSPNSPNLVAIIDRASSTSVASPALPPPVSLSMLYHSSPTSAYKHVWRDLSEVEWGDRPRSFSAWVGPGVKVDAEGSGSVAVGGKRLNFLLSKVKQVKGDIAWQAPITEEAEEPE